tara:strand:+ start:769 stop:999 length:231 start_codon:yes stop_codon:yes gene_type:complete
MAKTRNLQKRIRRSQRNIRKSRKNRRGGEKKGIIETAMVPFGLFALQHVVSRNNKKMKKRKTLKKGKGKNKFRMYK